MGKLVKVLQFGREFVMFRGTDGKVGVLDDVCPHLGAHLSEGGCVKGDAVRCPYHHWAFDAEGRCVDIPYAKKIPVKARTRSYPVVERYGMIFTYRNEAGSEPPYPLPEMDDFDPSEWTRPAHFDFEIRIHGQDIMENSVDSPHFAAVHGHDMPENQFRAEGKELRITQLVRAYRMGIPLDARLEFHMVEPGFHYVRFPEMPGTQALVFSSIVPIDEEHVNHRLTIWTMKTWFPPWSWLIRKFLVRNMMRTYREDLRIWENKEYLPHPVRCDGDGSIMKLRRWYAQFFENATPAEVPVRLDVLSEPRAQP